MPSKLTTSKLQLIEELGVAHEKGGMQPAAARVLALLLVSDKTELAFEEVYEILNLSKSATSNALNFLISTNRVEYTTHPGERRRYFRCKLRTLKDGIQESLTGLSDFNALLKRVLEQRPAATRDFNNNLKEVTQFIDFIKIELPLLFQKWEKQKA